MKEEFSNLSISGNQSQNLKLLHKVGSALFVLGLLFLLNGFTLELIFKLKSSTLIAFGLMLVGSMIFTFESSRQFSLYTTYSKGLNKIQGLGLLISLLGLSSMLLSMSSFGAGLFNWIPNQLFSVLVLGVMAIGILLYTYGSYAKHPAGIKNNYTMFNSLSNRGILGWLAGILLTAFYIALYWYPESLKSMTAIFDPISMLIKGKPADQWFLYGTLYTFVILFLGIKFMIKYRHNRYQFIRTCVVIFSQLVLAYFIPNILEAFSYDSATNSAGEYLGYYSGNPVNTWPLNYDFFTSGSLEAYTQPAYQPIGLSYFFWGLLMFLVVTPVVTYYVGKRWYCSWFCGCGGLAETAGDSFRHLSSKSTTAWNIERWVIHSVMAFILIVTVAILFPFFSGKEFVIGFFTVNKLTFFITASVLLILCGGILFLAYRKFKHKILLVGSMLFLFVFIFLTIAFITGSSNVFILKTTTLKKAYGFFVGSAFSGVIGVGFYPVLGNRVWCRFGCPMAGYMGLFQRFKSRFRITTNGGQCISCGNCSTYCEQGIDVRAYAQKGQNIVRSSCVGCGICSAVCPRGVLKLENGPEEGRIQNEPNLIGMLKN